MIKAIFFDFDGVIHDTFELGYNIARQFHSNFEREHFRAFFDGNLFTTVDKHEIKDSQDKFRELEHKAFQQLILERHIRDELLSLSQTFDLFIVSSNTEKNLNMYFENNDFVDIFKEIYAQETHKSKIEKFNMLFNKYDLSPEECIFITDTVGDILEANSVGLKSIAVTYGFHDKKRLQKVSPFKLIDTISEITGIIKQLNM